MSQPKPAEPRPKVYKLDLVYEIRSRNFVSKYELEWSYRLPTNHPNGRLTKAAEVFLAAKHKVLPQEIVILGMKEIE